MDPRGRWRQAHHRVRMPMEDRRRRIHARDYVLRSCAGKSLSASATSLTLTDDDGIANDTTYTFRVRAVNDRKGTKAKWC